MVLRGPSLLNPVSTFETGEELLAAVGRPLGTTSFTLGLQRADLLAAAGGRGGLFARLLGEVVEVGAVRADYRGCLRARLPAAADAATRARVTGQLLAACETADTGVECVIRLLLEAEDEPRLVCMADVVVCFYFAARPAPSYPRPERSAALHPSSWASSFGLAGNGLRPAAAALTA